MPPTFNSSMTGTTQNLSSWDER